MNLHIAVRQSVVFFPGRTAVLWFITEVHISNSFGSALEEFSRLCGFNEAELQITWQR